MLKNSFSLANEEQVLKIIVDKLILNLKHNLHNIPVIKQSLDILSTLSLGYATARLMASIDTMQHLKSVGLEPFPVVKHWLEIPDWDHRSGNYSKFGIKFRKTIFQIFGRLLVVSFGNSFNSSIKYELPEEFRFYSFIVCLNSEFKSLFDFLRIVEGNSVSEEQVNMTKWLVIGLTSALRGLAHAFNNKQVFDYLISWLWVVF